MIGEKEAYSVFFLNHTYFTVLFILTSGLHDAFQDDDDLKLLVHQRTLRQIEERALAVDFVADCQRRHEEELVCARPESHVQLTLIQRQKLALGGLTGLKTQTKAQDMNITLFIYVRLSLP